MQNTQPPNRFSARGLALPILVLLSSCLSACGSDDAKLKTRIADDIVALQKEFDALPASTVIKAMDALVLAELHKATPATLKVPVLAAAGVQHSVAADTLFVFWICANSRGDAFEIRSLKTGKPFTLPIPPSYAQENLKESQGGSLRLRMALSTGEGPPELKDAAQHPADFEIALRDGDKVITNWTKVLAGGATTKPSG